MVVTYVKGGPTDVWNFQGQIQAGTFASVPYTGAVTGAIDLTTATIAPYTEAGNTHFFAFALGHRTTGSSVLRNTVTMVGTGKENWMPFQMCVNVAGVNPGATSTVTGFHLDFLHSTADMAALRMQNADWLITVSKNALDVYNQQNEIDVTDTANVTGQLCAVSASVQISGIGNHTIGEAQALYASVSGAYGTGTITSSEMTVGKFVLSLTGKTVKSILELNASANAVATNGIYFDGSGSVTSIVKVDNVNFGSTNFVEFTSTAAPVGTAVTACSGSDASIKVLIGATPYYIPLYNSLSA